MILGTGPIIVSALTVTVRDLGTDDSRGARALGGRS
jgi:hypothetical protein